MQNLERQFRAELDQCKEAADVKRWIVALSGGLDSIVLLELAASALPAEQLCVLHIDHQLQIHSSQWADFCQRWVTSLGLPFETLKVSVDSAASLERAARDARYNAFIEFLNPGDCLLQGHHQSDQAETVLFRMLRGAGVRGLSGIPKQRTLGQGILLRPLLECAKSDLRGWAETQGLSWIEDPSNLDPGFDRNFLRHKVMPLLESRWPGFDRRWGQMAASMSEADRLLVDLAEIDLCTVSISSGQLDLERLAILSESRQVNLLRHWIELSCGDRISQGRMAALLQDVVQAGADSDPELELSSAVIRRYRNGLFLQDSKALEREIDWSQWSVSEAGVSLPEGELVVESTLGGLKSLTGVGLRNRREGDRCRPVGRVGSCTLKKLFQEKSIPPWLRWQWPVCVVGDEIVAVPGLCICEGWQCEKNVTGFALKWVPTALSDSSESGTL